MVSAPVAALMRSPVIAADLQVPTYRYCPERSVAKDAVGVPEEYVPNVPHPTH